jgi:hypothetical protein
MLSTDQLSAMQAYALQVMDQTASLARPTITAGTYGQALEATTVLNAALPCLLGSLTGEDIRRYPDLLGAKVEWRLQVPNGTDIQRNDLLTLASGDVLRVQRVLAPQSYTPTITVYASEVR